MVRPHHAVARVDGCAFYDRQNVALHAFAGNVRPVSALAPGDFVDLVKKDDAGLLHALHGHTRNLVHVDEFRLLFLDQILERLDELALQFLGALAEDVRQHFFDVDIFDALVGDDLEGRHIVLTDFDLHLAIVERAFAQLLAKFFPGSRCRVAIFGRQRESGSRARYRRRRWRKQQVEQPAFCILFCFFGSLPQPLFADHIDPDLHQVANHRFHIATNVTDLGEFRGFHLQKWRIGQSRQTSCDLRLGNTGGPNHDDVLGHDLFRQVGRKLLAAHAITQSDGHSALGFMLAYDVLVQLGYDFLRSQLVQHDVSLFRYSRQINCHYCSFFFGRGLAAAPGKFLGRAFSRITNFSPDHVSSIAQTFTSTSPKPSPVSRTRFSFRSVGLPEAFLGQAIHNMPAEASLAVSTGKSFSSAARFSTKQTTTSALPDRRSVAATPSGNLPRSLTKLGGWLRRTKRCPGLIPIFWTSGVPEYPAIVLTGRSRRDLLLLNSSKLFHSEILVGIDADLARDLHGLFRNFARREIGVLCQGCGGSQSVRPPAADRGHAAVRLDHVAGAADQKSEIRVRDEQQRFKMAQGLVGAPLFGQLDGGASQIAVVLLQLALKAREERQRIGRRTGKAGENLVVVKATDLFRRVLDHTFAQSDLAISSHDHSSAPTHADHGGRANLRGWSGANLGSH